MAIGTMISIVEMGASR